MVVEHPALRTAPNESRIWRYMDVGRFLALLRSSSLYFAPLRQFEDSWEGVHPEFVRERMERTESLFSQFVKREATDSTSADAEGLGGATNPEAVKRAHSLLTTWNVFIDHTAICCWHENPEESIAMWKLYTSGDEGVAISSTVEKLRHTLEDDSHAVAIASVWYVNHDEGIPPKGDDDSVALSGIESVFCKRRSFSHEREIRAVIGMDLQLAARAVASASKNEPKRNVPEIDYGALRRGVSIPIDLQRLIDRIVVSPKYPDWAIPALQNAINDVGLEIAVERSDVLKDPPSKINDPSRGHVA